MGNTLVYSTAGGVVVNGKGQMLALARTVTRDGRAVEELRLPKGHIDPGETEEQAALREVGEESGYWGVEIVRDLGTAHSSFSLNGDRYERDERYYLMRLTDTERQGAQPVSDEEALFEARWVPLSEADALLTYPTEKEFACRAMGALRMER
ncbi:MAG: NUDIX domain-containing protein [Candidatus Hydrogenedentes bacterium]|nr:NUDIX domain-containing protein [Candidatus Hydrogenedentota bacterium]